MSSPAVVSVIAEVEALVSAAIDECFPEFAGSDPVVRRSEHADFQANGALPLAKKMGRKPRDVAAEIAAVLSVDAEVSGPGFLNISLTDELLWRQVHRRLVDPRLGIGEPELGRRTVIDYSGPNIAKEMHVGHLRTTIIGDALARVVDFLGAEVIRQNHLGDWGTQFGMLIQYIDEHPESEWRREQVRSGSSTVSALDALYKAARSVFEADEEFANRARRRVVALQSGDADTLATWRDIVAESQYSFSHLYERLGVLLTEHDARGESSYNEMLPDVVAELMAAGIAQESAGAQVIFSEDVRGPDGEAVTLMVRKTDGGYGYGTTDLATIRYRIRELKADRLLYVVDSRQALHFRLVFEAARRAGWLTDEIEVEHVAFGTVLGPDGRPFKTRSGGTVKLMDLLDSAVTEATAIMLEKAPERAAELSSVAEQAGIGAVKYADLSTGRTKDYSFDVSRMVSFAGNTGVYLQYAHARIHAILRKAGDVSPTVTFDVPLHEKERRLALELDALGDTLLAVSSTLEPHRLCGYLYDVAKA
ncbi:MAG: arginine--tRNA ligase, partial [Angustibacter sp.]